MWLWTLHTSANGDEETVEQYSKYYENLMHTTAGMPSLAFVLAAEPIEFQQIIGMTSR